ncbi:tyrosine-type recombinase/integrase [Arsukibacterium sp.]|uniref:tyrosine-type recombinase/integrase n=1 Tax=Arsukibacterium sp. TaxID=1977258 RepID=UPI00299D0869|nr:tyrosine-type recombinase/integrase [Arsukibacterium sp.]MDX1538843.1 tyrosine-type recombinase/integrase [Arsukibacterium sp.]
MKTVKTSISERVIKEYSEDLTVSELRDEKSPLCIRFNKSREKATWYLVIYELGKKHRQRIGYWPVLKYKDALSMVPDVLKRIGKGEDLQVSEFKTVDQLLNWYLDRIGKEAVKSQSRRKGVISAINVHLLPRLDGIVISNIKKAVIDQLLIMPLQNADLKPSSIRQYFAVLKRVFASAAELDLITVNPMAGMKFSDHIQKRIVPKFSKLHVQDISRIVNQAMGLSLRSKNLIMFMILFGTRIGETRQMRWSYIDFDTRQIIFPEKITKTGMVHVLPITDVAYQLLKEFEQKNTGQYLFGSDDALTASEADKLIRSVSKGRFSAHDLRKAARSAWAELGIDYWVAERLLNHKPKGLDLVYIQADSLKLKREALERYHNWIFNSLKTDENSGIQK